MEQYAPRLIYIAGKISGLPEEEYQTNFQAAHLALSARYPESQIYNPAASLAELAKLMDHDTLIQVCLQIIDCCDAVAFMENWTDSRGAQIEVDHALRSGKRFISLKSYPDRIEVKEE